MVSFVILFIGVGVSISPNQTLGQFVTNVKNTTTRKYQMQQKSNQCDNFLLI
ncbi:hypothetical protein VIBNIAM115_30074 [Vibrio nigripulchritudo AM115]|nr:hypothetical protein VIBNIAM115_30074 [Vibrio nigripulchritudo AM115]